MNCYIYLIFYFCFVAKKELSCCYWAFENALFEPFKFFLFFWNFVTCFYLKCLLFNPICSKRKIWTFSLTHAFKDSSPFNFWNYSLQIDGGQAMALSLNIVILSPLSPLYSSLHVSLITTSTELSCHRWILSLLKMLLQHLVDVTVILHTKRSSS